MNHITLTASNVLMRYLCFVRMAHMFILVALRSKVYVSGRFTARSNPAEGMGTSFPQFVLCCVGNDLSDRLVTRSEESYRALVCVCVSNCVSPRNLNNN